MSEQDITKIAGTLYLEVQALKREIAALGAWISAYKDAAKALDSQLHPVLHVNRLTPASPLPPRAKVTAIEKLLEYPVDQLAKHIVDLQDKRDLLEQKERLLADMQ